METLFKDSEVFTKNRPSKITEKQHNDLLIKLANDIINEGWSNSDADTIITDLEDLTKYDSGFELAKELDGITAKGSYDIDTQFIEWLDDYGSYFNDILRENIKTWVNAHNIKPKFNKQKALKIKLKLSLYSDLKIGDIVYINSIYEKDATYGISRVLNDRRNTIYNFELIENSCVSV